MESNRKAVESYVSSSEGESSLNESTDLDDIVSNQGLPQSEFEKEIEDRLNVPVIKLYQIVRYLTKLGYQISLTIVKEAINDMVICSDIMLTSKGRDKFFTLAQYIITLYVKCMASSEMYGDYVRMNLIKNVRVANQMIQNISSGRKVFKFMKFIDEYKAFMQLIQKINT